MNEGCWHSKTFCHFLLWRREFCFDVAGNFELKKMTPNCMYWQNWLFLTFESLTIHLLYFLDSVKQCYLQTKKHAVTSSERAHSITYNECKQKRRWNRQASKRRYHVHYATQWNFIICNKLSHMTVTSPKQKWIRVADTVRRFHHFLLR